MKEIKNVGQGFTLLELLVVVLIIGILAGIALPQYKFAVEKARISTYLQVLKDIKKAQEIFYMTNGEYAYELSDLDIDVTNVCATKYANMLFNCKDKVYINNAMWHSDSMEGFSELVYCPSIDEPVTLSNYTTCKSKQEVNIVIYYDLAKNTANRGQTKCLSNGTKKGQQLCQFVTGQ